MNTEISKAHCYLQSFRGKYEYLELNSGLACLRNEGEPNGKPLSAVGNEISGTRAIYQVNAE